jgi:hypothetical protein
VFVRSSSSLFIAGYIVAPVVASASVSCAEVRLDQMEEKTKEKLTKALQKRVAMSSMFSPLWVA